MIHKALSAATDMTGILVPHGLRLTVLVSAMRVPVITATVRLHRIYLRLWADTLISDGQTIYDPRADRGDPARFSSRTRPGDGRRSGPRSALVWKS